MSVTSAPITALYRFYKNSTGSSALIAVASGTLNVGYDAQAVFSEMTTGLNQTNMYSFLTYKNLLYIFNGEDDNRVFTFASKTGAVEDMGVPSHPSSPSATVSATAGNLGNNSYYYSVSLQFDGYQEGNAGLSCAGTIANGSYMKVVLPSSANSRCTGRYIYRTRSGASILYRLATVADNTTVSYGDNIADTSLDTTKTAPIDYGVPGSYKYACLHDERVFLAGNKTNKSDVIYSDIRSDTSYPDVYPANNILRIASDDGDIITQIINDHLGQLIVFKNNSVRIIDTPTGSDLSWGISNSYSPQGCVAPYSAVTTPRGILYISRYGEQRRRIVLWTGQGVAIIPELEGIEPIITAIPETAMDDVRGHYHNGYYYLAYRTEGLYNDKVLVINLADWSCSIDIKNVGCFASWLGGTDSGELYTGSSDGTGYVYREDATSFDFLIRKKSELDEGSFSYTQSGGTEEAPTLGLLSALSASVLAGRSWANMSATTEVWNNLSTTNDTWWFTGEWYDAVREISAKVLDSILWNETSPEGTDIVFYVRTGDTQAACAIAAWSGPYSDYSGSSLAGVTAAKYIQIKVAFAVQQASYYDLVYLTRSGATDDDYLIKISASYGTSAESTIEFDIASGRIDLGDLNEVYKRLRKRLRSVKIEYEPESGSSGAFDFKYYLNGSTAQTGSFNTSYTTFPRTKIYNFPLGTYCEDFIYRIYSNSDTKGLTIKKIIFMISVEPLTVLK